jgi:hypothetical protein
VEGDNGEIYGTTPDDIDARSSLLYRAKLIWIYVGGSGSCMFWTKSSETICFFLPFSKMRVVSSCLIWRLCLKMGTLVRLGSGVVIRMRDGLNLVELVREMNSGFSRKSMGVTYATKV